ncbi:hypothetical protein Scel_02800 [Streptomyces cellostaticus]|nr:hypothetical protein Scel_02800 [Streptomyces cellostaticus]
MAGVEVEQQGAYEQLPADLLDASADLGAKARRTFRSVVLPMVVPSVAAGSVFTFSLSLGDYITVQIVGGKSQLIGNLVYSNIELNLPMAAALGTVPVVVIVLYLLAIRRTGALTSLTGGPWPSTTPVRGTRCGCP